jgi:hypothetical protein
MAEVPLTPEEQALKGGYCLQLAQGCERPALLEEDGAFSGDGFLYLTGLEYLGRTPVLAMGWAA